jgi:hypothetical protein
LRKLALASGPLVEPESADELDPPHPPAATMSNAETIDALIAFSPNLNLAML